MAAASFLDGPAVVNGILTIPLSGRISADSSAAVGGTYPLMEFVAGPENRLAAVAVRPYLENVETHWNPLVLYGPHGSGKSHLAHGLASSWRERFGGQTVQCLPAAQFAQDYAAAVAAGKLDRWRHEFRDADLLVLEDIGQLAEKRGAQQELIRFLDALVARNARVVITALTLPSHSSVLLSGLRCRLSGGLAVPLSWPAAVARRAILERVAQGLALPKRVVHSLADGLAVSVPTLIAALLELELKAKADCHAVDGKHVRRFMAERGQLRMPSLNDIASRSARYFGLKVADLKSPARRQALVVARGVAMYLARQLTGSSYQQIGAYFGGRDHTTVIHGCRRVEKLLLRDRATRQAIAELKRWLSASGSRAL